MPLFPLPVTVEILVNGTWLDISDHVYQRDTIQISGGRTARGDTSQPAQATLTLANDGRFSPNNASGLYYPYLRQNVQLRISVSATSSSSNVYSGFRFWGEVPEWPPLSDISGNDVYVQITASGPLRRIRKGGGEGSALQRYFATLTGLYAPIAYWPCEEDPDSGLIGSGVQGGANMTVVSGKVKWKAVSDFNGSGPIGVINGSTWTGVTSAFGSSGDDLFLAAGTYTWIASTSTVDLRITAPGGGAVKGQAGTAVGGAAAGGGGTARSTSLAVTPGQAYPVVILPGGAPGAWNAGGEDAGDMSFTGDAATLTAHGGKGAGAGSGSVGGSGGAGGVAGTGGFAGGSGAGHPGSSNAGAGGGGSGGLSAAGNNGTAASGPTAGSGGAAVTGGGKGGDGGALGADGKAGGDPGAGGGGGWADASDKSSGGAGAPGKMEFVYTSSGGGTQPSSNVLRFIVWMPSWGGNTGKVMVRALTSGTVARVDVQYRTGGNLRLFGYNSGGTQIFDSGNLSVGANGQTLMVSAELAKSGSNVAWAFSAIQPGADGVVAKTSGTVTTASMGSVSQVIVAPNGDITKTAVGHISIQYALIPLWKVSQALNGHHTESGIDRFKRLANEQALGHLEEYNEGSDHWGFESGTQSWVAVSGALTNPTTTFTDAGGDKWPTEGTHSLLLTCNGSANPSAQSPAGLSAQPCLPGDVVSVSADVYNPVSISNVFIGLRFYDATGAFISESDQTDYTLPVNEIHSRRITSALGQAPASTAFVAVIVGAHSTPANTTKLYIDHVHIHPAMGPQTRKQYKDFLEEVQDLDQGIMKEARELWGLKYRTRIRLINQSPVITLDYSQGTISPPLTPLLDVQNLKNDITVHRHKGSKVQVTLQSGQMSILEPPQGSGRYKKTLKAVAAADEQLAALAAHLLLLGTVSDERYPTITVNLARAGIAGNALAPLMSAVAGAEIGDVVQLTNLPAWMPSTTTKQLVIGYTETLGPYGWTITWNCQPYTPYVQVTTSIRRW